MSILGGCDEGYVRGCVIETIESTYIYRYFFTVYMITEDDSEVEIVLMTEQLILYYQRYKYICTFDNL